MAAFEIFSSFGMIPIYDATHSVQTPGGGGDGKTTGGNRDQIEVLARAAVAAGAKGVFMEVHPRPDQALSDGPNAFPLEKCGAFAKQLLEIFEIQKSLEKLI